MSNTVTFNITYHNIPYNDQAVFAVFKGNDYYTENNTLSIPNVPNGTYTYASEWLNITKDFSMSAENGQTIYPASGTIVVDNDSPTVDIYVYNAATGDITVTPSYGGASVTVSLNTGNATLKLDPTQEYNIKFSNGSLGEIKNVKPSDLLYILYNLTNSEGSNSTITVDGVSVGEGSSVPVAPGSELPVSTDQSGFTTWYPQSLFTSPTSDQTDITMPDSDTTIMAISPVLYVIAQGGTSGYFYLFMVSTADPPVVIKSGSTSGLSQSSPPTILSFNVNGLFYQLEGVTQASPSSLSIDISTSVPDGYGISAIVSDGTTIYVGTSNGSATSPEGHVYAVSVLSNLPSASPIFTPASSTDTYGVASLLIDNNGHLIVIAQSNDNRVSCPAWVLNTSDYSTYASIDSLAPPSSTGGVVYDGQNLIAVSNGGTSFSLKRYSIGLSLLNTGASVSGSVLPSQMLYDGTYIYVLETPPPTGSQHIYVFKDDTDLTSVTSYTVPSYIYQIAYAGQSGTIWAANGDGTYIYHIDGTTGDIISELNLNDDPYSIVAVGGICSNNPTYSSIYSTNGSP